MRKINLLILLCLLSVYSIGQRSTIESEMLYALEHAKTDSSKLFSLFLLIDHYNSTNPRAAIKYNKQAIDLAKKSFNEKYLGIAYKEAGTSYYYLGDYEKGVSFYLKYLRISENLHDSLGIAKAYNNLGMINMNTGKYKSALHYFSTSRNLKISMRDTLSLSNTYNNMGTCYRMLGDYKRAINYLNSALEIRIDQDEIKGIAESYHQVGTVEMLRGNADLAQGYLEKALAIKQELGDIYEIALTEIKLGELFRSQAEYAKAYTHTQAAIRIAEKYGSLEIMRDAYSELSYIYEYRGQYKKAINYNRKYQSLADSIEQQQNFKELAQLEAVYESEKAEVENKILRQRLVLDQADRERKEILIWAVGFFLLMMVMFAMLQYKNIRKRIKMNEVLVQQKEEALKQNNVLFQQKEEMFSQAEELAVQTEALALSKEELEKAKNNITSSIKYSLRIQNAIFPERKSLRKIIDYFIIYRPKDIVSGDFYWYAQSEDKQTTLIAAIDCTGHGVPGAFMSLIGHILLTEIIKSNKIYDPSKILNLLDKGVRNTLKQDITFNDDGMDVALCAIKHSQNKNNDVEVIFAGAKRPLYYFSDDKLLRIRGDIKPIGGRQSEFSTYTNYDLKLSKGDMLYLTTDGMVDQNDFLRKKYGTTRFTKTLSEIAYLPMISQKEALIYELENHQAAEEQRDDITILGVRI